MRMLLPVVSFIFIFAWSVPARCADESALEDAVRQYIFSPDIENLVSEWNKGDQDRTQYVQAVLRITSNLSKLSARQRCIYLLMLFEVCKKGLDQTHPAIRYFFKYSVVFFPSHSRFKLRKGTAVSYNYSSDRWADEVAAAMGEFAKARTVEQLDQIVATIKQLRVDFTAAQPQHRISYLVLEQLLLARGVYHEGFPGVFMASLFPCESTVSGQ